MIINLLSPFPIESQLIVTYSVVLKYEVSQCVLSFLWHLMLLVWPFSKDRFLKKHPPPLIFVIFWFWNTKSVLDKRHFWHFFLFFGFGTYSRVAIIKFRSWFSFSNMQSIILISHRIFFFSVILHVTNFGHCSEKAQLKPHYNP